MTDPSSAASTANTANTMPAPLSPTLSTTSSSASTTATVIDTHPNPKSLINLGKQLKYLSIGLALTLYFQVYQHLADALSLGIAGSNPAKLALLSVVLMAGTVVTFTWVILLPARGYAVNYVDWRRDVHLAKAIPLLTACIIAGWTTLLLTLSPLGAPAPPTASIRTRLSQAAAYTGLDSLQTRINAIPASYFPTATNPKASWDKIAAFLPHKDSASTLQTYFDQLSHRADEWSASNIKTIGWTGALLGSIGAYFAVFGTVGLIGFLAPDNRPNKLKSF
ncbi:hypothetical protein EX895_006399 [Sporisorium graminicola]|uniref:Uncharacterized protein n=1 Tax=Sporisorium graminicola TaxID=280036 RepID=A0A4U7KN88_9BASI|nr:hypothetical protein EX895_006399 [Sporisorium graminicola]TKY84498.1 hypothetical protein EX895_006399 [Sporisorium graminicola]